MEKDIRPWGEYKVLSESKAYKIKEIQVNPKQRLSLQRHQKRAEHWYILQGKALVTLGEEKIPLQAGESINIPLQAIHRVENTGFHPLIFIEVQTGESFDENDIERLEDDYSRK